MLQSTLFQCNDWRMANFNPRRAAGTTQLAPGITVWREIDGYLTNYAGFDMTALIRLHGRRFELDELTITRRDDGEHITGFGMRAIKPPSILRESLEVLATHPPEKAVGKVAFINSEPGVAVAFGTIPTADAAQAKADGPTDNTLRLVGRVYTLAYAVQDRQAKAVSETFGVSVGTANVWIAKAKTAGHIQTEDNNG